MAYLNHSTPQQRGPILVVIGALHAALIYALVTGLGGGVSKLIRVPPLVGTSIPLPQPSPSTAPDDEHPTMLPHPSPSPGPSGIGSDPALDAGTDLTFGTGGTIGGEGDGGGTLPPQPTPTATPQFVPKAARPLGTPGSWVTPDDYPPSSLRLGHEGVTRFQLSVSASGAVTGCAVVASSGDRALDAAACAKLLRRARFAAATDDSGKAVAGSYSGAVRWKLPPDYR